MNGSSIRNPHASHGWEDRLHAHEEGGAGGGAAASGIPEGWQEVVTPDGARALVPDLATRTLHARIAAAFAVGAGAVAILLIRAAHHDPALVPLAVLTGVATLALASAAMWLSRGLMEWVIGNGRVTLRRRFGSGARAVFEADRLELTDSSDGDGDRWFVLRAVAPGASAVAITAAGRFRKCIVASLRDPSRPRRLGDWIARTAGIPLEDRTGREAHEAEVAQLKAQLASSGRLGRFLSRLIDRAERSRQTS